MLAKNLHASLINNLPVLLELQRTANAERVKTRGELIQKINDGRAAFDREEALRIAEAAPLEKELTSLRAKVAKIERQLALLADARLSAAFVCRTKIKQLESELTSDASAEMQRLYLVIETTRNEISNWKGRRDIVLRNFRPHLPWNERVAQALQITLEAFNRVKQLALTEADVTLALNGLQEELVAAGIEVVEP